LAELVIERTLICLLATVVLISLVAAYLPRITPSLIALGIVAAVLRIVWFYTGRW